MLNDTQSNGKKANASSIVEKVKVLLGKVFGERESWESVSDYRWFAFVRLVVILTLFGAMIDIMIFLRIVYIDQLR